MTKEDKQLLIKDLSARLPYGVIVQYPNIFLPSEIINDRLREIEYSLIGIDEYSTNINGEGIEIEYVKPYLRPLSSINVEEKCKIGAIIGNGFEYKENELVVYREDVIKLSFQKIHELMEFLYQHHIDINNLIPMGLAIEAPEGMYL